MSVSSSMTSKLRSPPLSSSHHRHRRRPIRTTRLTRHQSATVPERVSDDTRVVWHASHAPRLHKRIVATRQHHSEWTNHGSEREATGRAAKGQQLQDRRHIVSATPIAPDTSLTTAATTSAGAAQQTPVHPGVPQARGQHQHDRRFVRRPSGRAQMLAKVLQILGAACVATACRMGMLMGRLPLTTPSTNRDASR